MLVSFQEYGYTSEESVQALNTHKSVKNALHFLTNSNHHPGEFLTFESDKLPALSINMFSTAVSANLSSASSLNPHGKPAVQDKPSGPNNPQQK